MTTSPTQDWQSAARITSREPTAQERQVGAASTISRAAPDVSGGRRLGVDVGDLLAGKYRVLRILGVGGMGVVVEAEHLKLRQRVAIKILLPEAHSDVDAVPRFEDEARASASLKSEHVARVSDLGELEDGAPYMVMECLEGEDVGSWSRRRQPLPIEDAVEVVLQTCEVLAEAHGLGIIHSDLKPSNLFCVKRPDETNCVKVLDFGISKINNSRISGFPPSAAATGLVMGSPVYMSPEQMRAPSDIDERTDIWGLGVILFELLAGCAPFNGATVEEIGFNVANQPTPSIRVLRPDAPPGLETVINTCMDKARHNRYPDVLGLERALAPFGPKRKQPSSTRLDSLIGASMKGFGEAINRRWLMLAALAAVAVIGVALTALCVARLVSSPSGGGESKTEVLPSSVPRREPPVAGIVTPAHPVDPESLPKSGEDAIEAAKAETKTHASTQGIDGAPLSCTLNLNTIPVSTVALDGATLGSTPKVGILTSPGRHTVTFDHAQYGRMMTTVSCQSGESKVVAIRLSREMPAEGDAP